MSLFRRTLVTRLEDEDWQGFSLEARSVFDVVKLSIHRCGIGIVWSDQIAFYSTVPAWLAVVDAELATGDKWWLRVHRLRSGGVLCWIRNGLRWEPDIVKGNVPALKNVKSELSTIPDCQMLADFWTYYGKTLDQTEGAYEGAYDGATVGAYEGARPNGDRAPHRGHSRAKRERERERESDDSHTLPLTNESPDRSQAAGPDGPPDFAGLVKPLIPTPELTEAEIAERTAAQRRQLQLRIGKAKEEA